MTRTTTIGIFVAPTDVGVAWRRERQAPRRSLREHTKKKIYYQEEELEREDEKYQNEVKEMNEERKDENEVLGKIELITGGRYRPVGSERCVKRRGRTRTRRSWSC